MIVRGEDMTKSMKAGDHINVGDVVHVRATVIRDHNDSEVYLKLSTGQAMWISAKDVVHVEPQPLKVGDKVQHSRLSWVGTILNIHNGYAWVDAEARVNVDANPAPVTVYLRELTRV